MRILLLIFIFVLSLSAEKVLVINSNANVEKYKNVFDSFEKTFKEPFKTIDISSMNSKDIQEY